jgi:hypothetical protein
MKHQFGTLLALGVLLLSSKCLASSPQAHEVPVEIIKQKLFPLLDALESDPAALAALKSAPAIDQLIKERAIATDRVASRCDLDSNCLNTAFRFSPAARAAILDGLGKLYRQSSGVKSLGSRLVCEDSAFPIYKSVGCERAFLQAVDDELTGLNNVIDIFGDGKPSTRGATDVAEYDTQGPAYRQTLNTLALNAQEASPSASLFQQGVLYACYLLIANRSDYVDKFPALDTVYNADAVLALSHTVWADYKYSAILVPGLGPEIAGVPLSAGGRARLRIAVKRYLEGEAPVIVVSGGFVHPPHTQFNEAVEMKKALIADFGIPSDAILIEPLARRTTTNLRNVARLLVRYGISLDKPVLVTTDVAQSLSITNGQIGDRCLKTLGYIPFQNVKQLSPVETSVQLLRESLQFDPRDPLDP